MVMDEIEKEKENILPLKHGRNIPNVHNRLTNLSPTPESYSVTIFEKIIEDDKDKENVDVWLKYLKWTEENNLCTSKALIELYERSIKFLMENENNKKKHQFLIIWLRYSYFHNKRDDLFKYLFYNQIGVDFYELFKEWAYFLEMDNRSIDSEYVYQLGIDRKVNNFEILIVEYNAFKCRMKNNQNKTSTSTERDDSQLRSAYNSLRINHSTNDVYVDRTISNKLEPVIANFQAPKMKLNNLVANENTFSIPSDIDKKDATPLAIPLAPSKYAWNSSFIRSESDNKSNTIPFKHADKLNMNKNLIVIKNDEPFAVFTNEKKKSIARLHFINKIREHPVEDTVNGKKIALIDSKYYNFTPDDTNSISIEEIFAKNFN